MVRHVKRYLTPHLGNNFLPHILRARSIAVLTMLVVAIFAYSGAREYLFLSTDWGAEVIASALTELTNADRANLSLPRLSTNSVLQRAAQLKANDMAARGYFAHNSPDGKSPWYWLRVAGYEYQYAGENLAINFTESRDVLMAWMNSPGHRNNILSSYFSEIGIATAQGYYNGSPTIFVVQMFGEPKRKFSLPPPIIASPPSPTSSDTNVLAENNVPEDAPIDPRFVAQAEPPKEPAVPLTRIVQSDTMIAVLPAHTTSDISILLVDAIREKNAVAAETNSTGDTLEGGLPSGKKVIYYTYLIIAVLVITPLLLLLRHELKVHHHRHIAYGLGLLFVMVFFLVMFDLVIAGGGSII